MITRSKISPTQRKQEEEKKNELIRKKLSIETAPFVTYKGKTYYYNTFIDCAEKAEKLLNYVKNLEDVTIFGFDVEWPFSFTTGPGKCAVIQISPNLEECYVLQVSTIKKLPKSLTELLEHPNVKLTGNNIKNDVRKLARDFYVNGDLLVEKCVDLGVYANSVLDRSHRWSLEKLVAELLELRINKDKSVRMSKWHIVPLSKNQINYAAIDAYVSLKLYQHLEKLSIERAID